jgi:hypothetical protein
VLSMTIRWYSWRKSGLLSHRRCQFHQPFMRTFFVQNFWCQNFKPKSQLHSFWCKNFVRKTHAKNVAEIDSRSVHHIAKRVFQANIGVWRKPGFNFTYTFLWHCQKCGILTLKVLESTYFLCCEKSPIQGKIDFLHFL